MVEKAPVQVPVRFVHARGVVCCVLLVGLTLFCWTVDCRRSIYGDEVRFR